jgi:hypothetical protein
MTERHPNYEKVARALSVTDLHDQAIADDLRTLAGLSGPSPRPELWTNVVNGIARLVDHYPPGDPNPVDRYELQLVAIPWIYGEKDVEHPTWEVWRDEIGQPELDVDDVENFMARFIRNLKPRLAEIMSV